MMTAEEFRQVALPLPQAEERETWGHPTFRVRDKLFASLSDDGRLAGIKTSKQEQLALVAAYDAGEPGRGRSEATAPVAPANAGSAPTTTRCPGTPSRC